MEVPLRSPLIQSFDPGERKERSERNKRRINDFMIGKDNEEAMSLCSQSLSSSSISLASPKITITESEPMSPNSCTSDDDTLVKLTRVSTNSREKLILVPYGDDGGLLNQNKKPFDDVNFCFVCEKEGLASPIEKRRKNTVTGDTAPLVQWGATRASSPAKRRPRSTSAIGNIGRDVLHASIEKTGSRMSSGLFIPVYRQVFLCTPCHDTARTEKKVDANTVIKITARARAYFI